MTTCKVCGIPFKTKATGRPRLYCSDRCKEKDKRRRRRVEERESFAQARAVLDEPEFQATAGDALCHVCGAADAVVGTPEPLLCIACSSPG